MKRTSCTANTLQVPIIPVALLDNQSAIDLGHDTTTMPATKGELRLPAALSPTETEELEQCEGILERGLATFFEVGNALLRIRDKRLYRTNQETFEQYCNVRWHIGRSYAWRVIGAAERVNLLPSSTTIPRPANEFQVRPFLKLSAKDFPSAWRRAVKMAKMGKVTPRVAQAVVFEILPRQNTRPDLTHKSQWVKKRKIPIGQILVLLQTTKYCVEKSLADQAIEALDRIEKLLCGSP